MQLEKPYPFVDRMLARRLERAEAKSNAAFVDARRAIDSRSGATWIEVGGAWAMFDGSKSPLTQAFGLGLTQAPTDEQMETIETFFRSRGAPVILEVSPLAEPTTLEFLNGRGYKPAEFSNVMFRPAGEIQAGGGNTAIPRVARDEEIDEWAELSAKGWGDTPAHAEFMRGVARVVANSRGTVPFVAEIEGRIVATGALTIHQGVALFAGASTLAEARKMGAQRALLECRSRYAVEHGCDVLMMVTHPGSTSQKNGERQGFRVAYTRTKWLLVG